MDNNTKSIFAIADQNNSGGYIIQKDEVNAIVIVEGKDMGDCYEKFGYVTEDNSYYCSCCGERWWGLGKVKEEKEEILFDLEHIEGPEDANCIIHFLDGTSKNVNLEDYYSFEEDY